MYSTLYKQSVVRAVGPKRSFFSHRLPLRPPSSAIQKRFFGVRHKAIDLDDAVAVVKDHDTLCVSGFVAQSCPEALLRALGERFERTGSPKHLTLLFGGGPGDYDCKGLNHLAKPGMLKKVIGGHYGQTPKIAEMVLRNEIAGYSLPMGSISRMIRATASHTPGHITKVGLGTFVDPRQSGGALNDLAKAEPMVEILEIDNHEYLRYRNIPVDVSFIRATTADPNGNLTMEHESILGDTKVTAMAARSSGGVVIAQVERLAYQGSLMSRNVHIPGAFVDCVVIADKSEHGVNFFHRSNPVWTGEIREPLDNIPKMALSARKVIARRAAMELKPDDLVNLGIGMPDGVASVAYEEGIFQYVTLTTEPGVIGGVGATGHDFGPATNPEAFNEMNQQFDFYNGSGLTVCFLGLAECGPEGNVNVSRLTSDSLTGPGGFIDIAQCTQRVVFMGTFTKKGLRVGFSKDDSDGYKVTIDNEGQVATFKNKVREITFSGKQALINGQDVLFITERCVFKLHPKGLELVEIAPGMDLQTDIVDLMDVPPYIRDEKNIPLMDSRLFDEKPMNLYEDMFNLEKQKGMRLEFHDDTNTLFFNLQNFVVRDPMDIVHLKQLVTTEYAAFQKRNGGRKFHCIVNYDGFDCKSSLVDTWYAFAKDLEMTYYETVKRYSSHVFLRQKLGDKLQLESDDKLWYTFSGGEECENITRSKFVSSLREYLKMKPSVELVQYLVGAQSYVSRHEFPHLLIKLREFSRTGHVPACAQGHETESF